jgi:hypothetical protein
MPYGRKNLRGMMQKATKDGRLAKFQQVLVRFFGFLTEEMVELLTSPLDLAGYKDAITECMLRGTARNIQSESSGEGNAAGA